MTGGPVDWLRRGGDPQRATYLELFLDLFYVLALTRLSASLAQHLDWVGAYRTLILAMAVWWTWVITTWVTDLYENRHAGLQLVVLTTVLGVLVMATSTQGAYAGQGLVFAAAYSGLHIVRGLALSWALRGDPVRRRPLRILVWFAASTPLWLSGGVVHGWTRLTLWTLAVAVDYLAGAAGWPLPSRGGTPASEWRLGAEHLSERYRQMFTIALGDTILTMGIGYVETPSTPARAAALISCFLTTVLLWRIYLRFAAQLLATGLSHAHSPIGFARRAAYHHLLMVLGVVLTAVGNKVTIHDPFGAERAGWTLPIVGGPALFLVGRILFGHLVLGRVSPSRIIGLAALLVLLPFTLTIPPLAVTSVTMAVLGAVLLPNAFRPLARALHEPLP